MPAPNRASRIRASVLCMMTGLAASGHAAPSFAQASATRAEPPAHATIRAPALPRTMFTIDGTPVHIWAPTAPPYAGSAYDTIGGQPGLSGDSLMMPGARESGR